jgi:hypothetical protein
VTSTPTWRTSAECVEQHDGDPGATFRVIADESAEQETDPGE